MLEHPAFTSTLAAEHRRSVHDAAAAGAARQTLRASRPKRHRHHLVFGAIPGAARPAPHGLGRLVPHLV